MTNIDSDTYQLTAHINDNDILMSVNITFHYVIPNNPIDRQHPFHGSISLHQVADLDNHQIDIEKLPFITHALIRRACWDYLEINNLLKSSNVTTIALYPSKYK